MFRSLSLPCLLVVGLLVPSLSAEALPLRVTGFGDSLTVPGNDGRYLDHLNDHLDADADLSWVGFPGRTSSGVLNMLRAWLDGGNTTDVAIILSGTPDVFKTGYSESSTVGSIADMIGDLAAVGIPAILMAPPRVLDPCDDVAPTGTCPDVLNARLSGLSSSLAGLATSLSVPFLDLFALFDAQADLPGLYLSDGVHWRSEGGDWLVAENVAPLVTSLPEPGTLLLLGSFLVLAAARRMRRVGS